MMLVTKSTNATGFQNQRCLSQWLPGPAHGKGAEDMTVCDNEDVSGGIGVFEALAVMVFSDICDDCVKTTDDVFGGSVLVSLTALATQYE
jgi:hypothetical protein